MSHPLDGPIAKVDRAHEHLIAFDKIRRVFLDSDPYRVDVQLDAEKRRHVYRLEVRELPPISLGILLGDFAHNLRSALDHLAWQLALLGPTAPDPLTDFPIYVSGSYGGYMRFKGRKRLAGNLPVAIRDDVMSEIDSLQPYRGGDSVALLALLYWLSNTDKHKIVLPLGYEARFSTGSGPMMFVGPFQDGPIAEIPISYGLEPKLDPQLSVDVLLLDPMIPHIPFAGSGALVALHDFLRNDALPRFARFFP